MPLLSEPVGRIGLGHPLGRDPCGHFHVTGSSGGSQLISNASHSRDRRAFTTARRSLARISGNY